LYIGIDMGLGIDGIIPDRTEIANFSD